MWDVVHHVVTQLLIQLLHLQIGNRDLDCSLLAFIVICMESKFFLFLNVILQGVVRLEELDESITDLLVNEVFVKFWWWLFLFLDLLGGLSNLWLLFLFLAKYGAQEPKKTFGFLLYCLNVFDNSINFMGNVSNNLPPFFVHLASIFAELESPACKCDKSERIHILLLHTLEGLRQTSALPQFPGFFSGGRQLLCRNRFAFRHFQFFAQRTGLLDCVLDPIFCCHV